MHCDTCDIPKLRKAQRRLHSVLQCFTDELVLGRVGLPAGFENIIDTEDRNAASVANES